MIFECYRASIRSHLVCIRMCVCVCGGGGGVLACVRACVSA